MKTEWLTNRSVRIGVLLIMGFMIGSAVSYVTAVRKAEYMRELRKQEAAVGNRVVRDKNGNIKIIPIGKPTPGTEDLSKLPDEPEEKQPEKTETPTPDGESLAAPNPEVTADFLAKQAKVKAHTQPPIGLYLPGTFTLQDMSGKEVTEKSWPGKYLMVFFGFTHCPDICPVTLGKISAVLDKLGPLAKRVQPLFITVDPVRDTPEALKAYIGKFDKSIIGLTGTAEQIKKAEDSFSASAAKAEGETQTADTYNMNHSAYIYLMSPDNKLEELIRIEHSTQTVSEKLKLYLMAIAPQ